MNMRGRSYREEFGLLLEIFNDLLLLRFYDCGRFDGGRVQKSLMPSFFILLLWGPQATSA